MRLEHTFTVPADLDTVWQAVLEPERVAPCMPGATLTDVDGDSFSGTVKVRLGPVSLLYKGSGEFVEKDEQARRVVIKASGKDSRGNGTAAAKVTVTLRADGAATAGSVHTDLSITGKPAQFGRGMISEVGGKILNAFATCLATKLAPGAEVPDPRPQLSVVDTNGSPSASTSGARGRVATKPVQAKPKLAAVRPEELEPEPIDLVSFAGPSLLKRAAPVLAALAALLIVIIFRRRR